jgi:dephospho-CoA kinase
MKTKPIIGILGGVGCGKSTAASFFAQLGCAVIDADGIAHRILDKPEIKDQLIKRWGVKVLNADGTVNRTQIAEWVFGSMDELNFLNSLVHPRVLEHSETMIKAHRADPNTFGIVLDMPLLLEVGWEKKCDFLIFISCLEEKRRERIARKAKIDVEQLEKREKSQFSLDKKKSKAHYVVCNNSDKSDMAEQIARIFSIITENET